MTKIQKILSDNHLSGFLLAIIAAVAFSSKAIFVKLAYAHGINAIPLLTLRMGFALPFFLVVLFMEERKASVAIGGRMIAKIIGLGFIGYYLSSLFDFLGLMYISAGLERLILFLYPTMTVLLTFLVFRKPLDKRLVFALLLGYVGIALAIQHELQIIGENVLLGLVLVFSATLTYAVYLVGSGEIIPKVGSRRFTAYAMIISCVAVFVHFLLACDISELVQPMPVYGYGFAMAFFSTVIPAFVLSAAISRIGASKTSVIGAIGPVATIALAFFFLEEPISLMQIFGGACVIAGVMILKKKPE